MIFCENEECVNHVHVSKNCAYSIYKDYLHVEVRRLCFILNGKEHFLCEECVKPL